MIRARDQSIGSGVRIAEDVEIECDELRIGAGAVIKPGVRIAAATVSIGNGTKIERGTQVRGLGGPMTSFVVGDQCLVGFNNQILAPEFAMLDYSQLHNSCLASGYQPLTIGYNCWIGQSSILNCTERLSLGNNVRIGSGSQLWTHVASGELLEGCTLWNERPLVLEDNVWLVGGGVISPGLIVARNSIIMTGAVLTKSTEAFHTYAGVPASDVTDKLNFWTEKTIDEKQRMMRDFVGEFAASAEGAGAVFRWARESPTDEWQSGDIVIASGEPDWKAGKRRGVTLLDLESKFYLKQSTPQEVALLRWLVGFRARFIPVHSMSAMDGGHG